MPPNLIADAEKSVRRRWTTITSTRTWPVCQQLADYVAQADRRGTALAGAVDVGKLRTRLGNHRGVNNGQHCSRDRAKADRTCLVGVLKGAKIDMPFEASAFCRSNVAEATLLFQVSPTGGTASIRRVAPRSQREGRVLVQGGIFEPRGPSGIVGLGHEAPPYKSAHKAGIVSAPIERLALERLPVDRMSPPIAH